MKHRLLLAACVLFVLSDWAATFVQYSRMPLDGDLTNIVRPGYHYAQVLRDPFGWAVLSRDSLYASPNRFFANASQAAYFRAVPRAMQAAGVAPIDSVYAAQGLFSALVQALLTYLLAVYLVGSGRLGRWQLWLAMALLTPFFQAQGYASEMALVPRAVTYAFAYALPLVWLLLLGLPFYRWGSGQGWRVSGPGVLGCLGLLVVLAFNGPLVPGILAVLLLGAGVQWLRTAGLNPVGWLARLRQVPKAPLLLGLAAGLLCAYSLYIGRNNLESAVQPLPLSQRYALLPAGVWSQLTGKLGVPVLVLACLGNAWLLRRAVPATAESVRIRAVLRWLGGFALLYVLLLPLGGYRNYRTHVLRFDTISPITLGLVFFYGLSALYLLRHLAGRARAGYAVFLALVFFIYANSDRHLAVADNNECERTALAELGWPPPGTAPIHLTQPCPVVLWDPPADPAYSANSAYMLYYWGITPAPRLYYQ